MSWVQEYSGQKPLFYWGERPVSATLFLVGLHVLGLLFVSLCKVFNNTDWVSLLTYSNQDVFQNYQIWQWVTYAFLSLPTFSFLIDMLVLYFFGKSIEEVLGVKRYLAFYFALVMTGPVLMTFLAPWFPVQLEGALSAHFGLVVAVAFLFPESEMAFIRIPIRIVMWILFALYTLQFVVFQKYSDLTNLWITSASAWMGLQLYQGAFREWMEEWSHKRHAKKHSFQIVKGSSMEAAPENDYDAVLEKISKKGIQSLNASEKKILENKRQELLEKDRK